MSQLDLIDSPSRAPALPAQHDVRLLDELVLSPAALSHRQAVNRVIQAMHERLDESFALEEMSRIGHMSQYHFNRTFRQTTGIPPCQFLYALRLQAAKRMLLTTGWSVTKVCFEVGYNSLGTFTRRFTEMIGVSPGCFRGLTRFPLGRVLSEAGKAASPSETEKRGGVSGSVSVPPGFLGTVFIGLFKSPIPQGNPVAGTVVNDPSFYHIAPVPDGCYYLLAVGIAGSEDPQPYLLYEFALRGGGQPIWVRDGGKVRGNTSLALRPPQPFDPPILRALPLLLSGPARDAFAGRRDAPRLH